METSRNVPMGTLQIFQVDDFCRTSKDAKAEPIEQAVSGRDYVALQSTMDMTDGVTRLPVEITILAVSKMLQCSVADPGFPIRGGVHPLGGRGPPTQVLFSENVCENERIGSHRGWHALGTPPPQIRQWCCIEDTYTILH